MFRTFFNWLSRIFRRVPIFRPVAGPARLLFVCTGNTCRSPLAEALAQKMLGMNVICESAGTGASWGSRAADNSVAVAAEYGVDLSDHYSQPLRALSPTKYDVVVGIGSNNWPLCEMWSDDRIKVIAWDIPDPFGGPLEVYRETAKVIEKKINRTLGEYK